MVTKATVICTGWAKKVGHILMATILSNVNRFENDFLPEDSFVHL